MTETFVILGAGTAGLLAAIMMREKFPHSKIVIVKSSELGIVGVGEGSTEHFAQFLGFVGINHLDVIFNTKATIKIGILFKDWNLGTEYGHSVGSENRLSGLWKPEILHHLLLNSQKKFPTSPLFNIYRNNEVILENTLNPSNQYHFDTFALNSYFVQLCQKRNIQFIECKISDINVDEYGDVINLVSEDGLIISGDFFIDCSGFRRVISSKVGVEWEDYSKYLPMNHAIAFPTEHEGDNYEPYTSSTALKNGWVWRIPTQERYGNGYVFCDDFINSDQALNEINEHLGKNVEKVGRDIKFKAGRVKTFWKNNVLNIGLSSSFVEPLEAQSIGFTIIQMFEFLKIFDHWRETKNPHFYNCSMNICFDNIVDYIQLHYITKREDSDFWRSKPYELTNFNEYELPILRKGIFDYFLLNHNLRMFNTPNFYQIIAGLDLFDKEHVEKHFTRNRSDYNEKWFNEAKNTNNHIPNTMKHKKFIELVNYNYMNRIKDEISV